MSILTLGCRKEGDKILTIMAFLLLNKLNKNRDSIMHQFEEFLREYRLLPRETKALLPAVDKGVLQKLRKFVIRVEISIRNS